MEIKFAEPKDFARIIKLLSQVHRDKNQAENPEEMLEILLNSDYCDIVVAKDGNTVVGSAFLFYHPSPFYGRYYSVLEEMVVDEGLRGKGIGADILKKIIDLSKKRNCYKIIFTSGFDREQAHKFYEKFGFDKWGLEFRMNLNKNS